MQHIELGNKSAEPAGNQDEFSRLSTPQSSVVFSKKGFAAGWQIFAVTESATFNDSTNDTQIQTAVLFDQIVHVQKNSELSNYYSVAKHLWRSIFYVLHVIPSNPPIFSNCATNLNVIELQYDAYIPCHLNNFQLVTELSLYTLLLTFT